MAYEKKVGLGTKWGWVKRDGGPKGHFWTVQMLQGHNVGAGFRVGPHPYQDGWTVDLLPWLGPWETYIDGPFKTPQAAARALVKKSKTWRSWVPGGKKRHGTPKGRLEGLGPYHMRSGYAYKLEGSIDWLGSSDELWDTVMVSDTPGAKYVGSRYIDGSAMAVFKLRSGYYAQLEHMTRSASGKKRHAGDLGVLAADVTKLLRK